MTSKTIIVSQIVAGILMLLFILSSSAAAVTWYPGTIFKHSSSNTSYIVNTTLTVASWTYFPTGYC